MNYHAAEIAEILNAKAHLPHPDAIIRELAIDSRKIYLPANSLFFALQSNQNDGHKYLLHAYEGGVRNFLVSHTALLPDDPAINYFVVKDPLKALQRLAAHHRKRFDIPIVAITGSNGKTSTKEWLYEVLSERFQVRRSPKSYNSQIGVPLSVWLLDNEDRLGIFEAGISKPGEMEALEKILQPTHGILTNIGPAHDEGFGNRIEKLQEKLKLFVRCRTLVYCRDHDVVQREIQKWKEDHPDVHLLSWGTHEDADIKLHRNAAHIIIHFKDKIYRIQAPVTDAAAIENIMHVFSALLALELNPDNFIEAFSRLEHLPLRLELKNAINGSLLIYDCYNNDLRSLQIALDYQEMHGRSRSKTVILSDILESGKEAPQLYREMAYLLNQKKITRLIGVGDQIVKYLPPEIKREMKMEFYRSTEACLRSLDPDSFHNEIILLKGARKYAFERIGPTLEEQVHGTRLLINLEALRHNFNHYRSMLRPGVKMMIMVKALAYGSGMDRIASVMQYHRADYLAVAYADEGIALRKAGIQLPILVMNTADEAMSRLLQHHLEPQIFSFRSLDQLLNALLKLEKQPRPYPVHIKIDTGMHRLGFDVEELPALLEQLQGNRELIKVKSIFSHLAASEDPGMDAFTKRQIQSFEKAAAFLSAGLGYTPLRHIANSAAISRFPNARFDMVRLGLGLYGIDPSGQYREQLMPVAALYTSISQIRRVPAGEGIGYGLLDASDLERRIAIVGIGYADGFSRQFSSGRGHMFIHGKLAPVVGSVCMDMTLIDISHIPDAREGDVVEVFGKNLRVETLSERIATIPYEIIAGLSGRIERVYTEE